jgi:hypothetical protein
MTVSRFFLLSAFAAVLLMPLSGCQTEDSETAGSRLDQARQWVEDKSSMIKDVGEMVDAYERNDMERAAAELDSLRGTINWDKMASPQMRDRILTIGTEVYAALGRPEDAARLIETALPHLDGELKAQWDDLRARLESGPLPATLEEGTTPAE